MSEPFIDFFGLKDGDSVLDVGCGLGSLTQAIAAATSVECVTGIDPGEAYVAFAGERAADPAFVTAAQTPAICPSPTRRSTAAYLSSC